MTVDGRERLTPAGGVESEVVYLDQHGREVAPAAATCVVIREIDAEGGLLAETWGTIERRAQ